MQRLFKHLVDGQEVTWTELDSTWDSAAKTEDVVFSELLRMIPYSGSVDVVDKAIIPAGFRASNGSSSATKIAQQEQQVVRPTTGGVQVSAFRAVVGSRAANLGDFGSPSGAYYNRVDIRTGVFAPTSLGWSVDTVSIPANTGGTTVFWVLYAQVAVCSKTNSTRYGRAQDGTVGSQVVAFYTDVVVTVDVAEGLPADDDAAGVYNIPLAVIRAQPSFTDIELDDIIENAPVVTLHPSTGAVTMRPAGICNKGGIAPVWGDSGARPSTYLPSTMVGGQTVWILMNFIGGWVSVSDGQVLDDSIDWRNRLFTWIAQGVWVPLATNPSVTTGNVVPTLLAGAYGGAGSGDQGCAVGMGQSLRRTQDDPCTVARFDDGTGVVRVLVDTQGRLVAAVTEATPVTNMVFCITASGQFVQA